MYQIITFSASPDSQNFLSGVGRPSTLVAETEAKAIQFYDIQVNRVSSGEYSTLDGMVGWAVCLYEVLFSDTGIMHTHLMKKYVHQFKTVRKLN